MRVLAAALLAISVAACGDSADITVNQVNTVVGSWSLQSIGGATLPFLLDQLGDDKIELMEAALTTTANGAFVSTSVERTTIAGQATSRSFSEDGNYTTDGAAITFTFSSDGASVTGIIRGDSLTFAESGSVVVYRRR
jgi:hypothetical protein